MSRIALTYIVRAIPSETVGEGNVALLISSQDGESF